MRQSYAKHGDYEIWLTSWSDCCASISQLRHKVFVLEQRLGSEFVEDQEEEYAQHIIATDQDNQIVACGRLTPDGRIGRIAVSLKHRQHGLGTRILSCLIECARQQGLKELSLNAETDLQPFYLHQNFHRDGPVFMKQGIPHQRLRCSLNA